MKRLPSPIKQPNPKRKHNVFPFELEQYCWSFINDEHMIQFVHQSKNMEKALLTIRCGWKRLNTFICETSAKHGFLNIFKSAHSQNGCGCDLQTLERAALNGHSNIIKYAFTREPPCPMGKYILSNAATYGDLNMVKYLHGNGCALNPMAPISAAGRGHLEIVKYMHENKFPWDDSVAGWAALYGYLNIVKYIYENGCPYDESVILRFATYGKQQHILDYISSTSRQK